MKIKIEKITEKEAYSFAKIKIEIWKTCYNQILPEKYLSSISISQKAEKYQKEIQNDPLTSYYFIIVSDTPVGILRLNYYKNLSQEMCVCIKDLYFLQSYQRKGYGGFALDFIIEQATENHCHYITAWIIEQNQAAKLVVSKLGFRQTTQTQIHDKTGVILYEYQYDLYDRPKLLIS